MTLVLKKPMKVDVPLNKETETWSAREICLLLCHCKEPCCRCDGQELESDNED